MKPSFGKCGDAKSARPVELDTIFPKHGKEHLRTSYIQRGVTRSQHATKYVRMVLRRRRSVVVERHGKHTGNCTRRSEQNASSSGGMHRRLHMENHFLIAARHGDGNGIPSRNIE